MTTISEYSEKLEATWVNTKEFLGGVAAPLLVALAGIIFLTVLALCWRKFRPRHRIGFAIVPDPEFDPSDEEILRWSLGLAEARAAVGFASDSHRFVRLAICSDEEGNLVSLLGVNPRARSVAERTGYTGCELFSPEEILGANAPAWLPALPAAADLDPPTDPAERERVVDSLEVNRPPQPTDDGWIFLPSVNQDDVRAAIADATADLEAETDDVVDLSEHDSFEAEVVMTQSHDVEQNVTVSVATGSRWEGLL